jgi:hypothetical protein
MAAKRLGQFLSNVTGTSGQILRVKVDESGFEMFTPAGLPTYTITNDTTDRVIDADVTTSDEIVDVLCTLIKDITTLVGGPVAFQWSTSEQVYPFEKDSSGNTLYCKEVDFGALPNAGVKSVAHGIDVAKVFSVIASANNGSASRIPVPSTWNSTAGAYDVFLELQTSNITIQDWIDWSMYSCKVRLIYAK